MTNVAYIESADELASFTATCTSAQFPAAASPVDSLCKPSANGPSITPSGQVLVTAQGSGVQMYSTTNSKCLRSWAFSPKVRFACPAKYSPKYDAEGNLGASYVYVALSTGEDIARKDMGTVVWRWTDKGMDSVGLENKIVAKYTSPIFALEAGVAATKHLLVVHKDSKLTLATEDMDPVHTFDLPVPAKSQTLWYQLMDVSQSMRSYIDSRQVVDWMTGDVFLALVLSRAPDADNKGQFVYYLSLVAVDGAESTIIDCGTTQISPSYLATQPIACTFDADTGALVFITEAGVYLKLNITSGHSAVEDAIIIERTKEVILRGFVPCIGSASSDEGTVISTNLLTQSQLSITTLSEKYVAIAGTHSVVSHAASGPYESVLTLWDLQYGCMHAEKKLAVAPECLEGAGSGDSKLPRLTYQVQSLSPRLNEQGKSNDQILLAVTVSHTLNKHVSFDKLAASSSSSATKPGVTWSVQTFTTSAYLPPVTLLASLRLQNNPKYYIDPVVRASRSNAVHSSNILLREEQEQGLGVLRSGWEAVVDGRIPKQENGMPVRDKGVPEALANVAERREATQESENEVLLALANTSDATDSEQYTKLFMDHIGIKYDPSAKIDTSMDTWISSYLMTTVMRRCFAEPLGVSRSSRLPLFAPRVIEFMLVNSGLCNFHAPAPGLLPHLLARVDAQSHKNLEDDAAWGLINIALKRCPDIPEKHIGNVLHFQLSHYEEHLDKLFRRARFLSDCSNGELENGPTLLRVGCDIMRTVASVAALSSKTDTLHVALSSLSASHITCIIRLINIWLLEFGSIDFDTEAVASARFLAAAETRLAREHDITDGSSYDTAEALDIRESRMTRVELYEHVLKQLQNSEPVSKRNVPTIEPWASLFVPTKSDESAANTTTHSFGAMTDDWIPELELPAILNFAPTMGQTVEFASKLIDGNVSKLILGDRPLQNAMMSLQRRVSKLLKHSISAKDLNGTMFPFYRLYERNMEKRLAAKIEHEKVKLGLEHVVTPDGRTESEMRAPRSGAASEKKKAAQGIEQGGHDWKVTQNVEKYRVEAFNW